MKTVDYVACWYWKAAEYAKDRRKDKNDYPIRIAFVSTNSICQGQQVEPIWKPLFEKNFHIDFAWTSFKWNNEASHQAQVNVIIIGFSKTSKVDNKKEKNDTVEQRTLYVNGRATHPDNINAYLSPAQNVFVRKRAKPITSEAPIMITGGKPVDGGNLIFSSVERDALIAICPECQPFIRPFMGSDEFINGKSRFCLWLQGLTMTDIEKMPPVKERVARVREMRLASKKEATRKSAATPWLFQENKQPNVSYIAIPQTSSEQRFYLPIGYLERDVIASNGLMFIPSDSKYVLGLMLSQFHNAWMRAVGGRFGMGYRYSNTIIYNNFVWPTPTIEQRHSIEECAQAVLNARNNYPGDSLAVLYDPDKMPEDLLAAHQALDAAVEAAYKVDVMGNEEKIVTRLFELYADKNKTAAE